MVKRVAEVSKFVEAAGEDVFHSLIQLVDYDAGAQSNVRIVETRHMGNCARDKIVFDGRPNRVPGYIGIPNRGEPPHSVVLLFHDQSNNSSKSNFWDSTGQFHFTELADRLLDQGFAIVTLDAPHHGERTYENDFAPVRTTIVKDRSMIKYRDIIVDSVIEHRILMDYLSGREDIDAGEIGALGCSMGAATAFILSAADPRIKVTVAASIPTSGPWINNRYSSLALQNYTLGIRNAILLQMGEKDSRFPPEQAKSLLAQIPSANKALKFYDCGHFLTAEYIPDAVGWFNEHFGKMS